MRKCIKCGIEKQFSEFYKHKNKKDGIDNQCKTCCQAYRKIYNAENRLVYREKQLKRKFNLSLDDYADLLESQDKKCAICYTDKCVTGLNFAVDHNHETGEIRGLLCSRCNTAIGRFQDNPSSLKNAYQYLIEKGHYGQEAA